MFSLSVPGQASLQQALLRANTRVVSAEAMADGAVPPPTSIFSALQQFSAEAAVIFTGSVSTVKEQPGGAALVTFAVEQGIRGVASGGTYSIRVSAWAGGTERYHPGERALFLLTAPSVAGYSASVRGEFGVVPLSGDALVGNFDLRWIASGVQRDLPALSGGVETRPVAPVVSAMAVTPQHRAGTVPAANANAAPAATTSIADVHAIDRDLILDLLRTGARLSGAAR